MRTAVLCFLPITFSLQAQNTFFACQPHGGEAAVKAMVEQELRFPAVPLAQGVKGDVLTIFTVEADGTLRDLRVWQGLQEECDREALRLTRLVQWQPALYNGQPHAAEHYLRFTFDPKAYRKWQKVRALRCAGADTLPSAAPGPVLQPREVEVQAEPMIAGGYNGWSDHLSANLRYPTEAYRRDIQGQVKLTFVVETNGVVSNLRAVEDLGGGCTEEAMRIVRGICWKPAMKAGKAVRSLREVSIRFVIAPKQRE
ncbi:MAG: TonB family protein [Flavobacteriales bacterium]|nr:TonB family protein [Flavobacteriales bacterium]